MREQNTFNIAYLIYGRGNKDRKIIFKIWAPAPHSNAPICVAIPYELCELQKLRCAICSANLPILSACLADHWTSVEDSQVLRSRSQSRSQVSQFKLMIKFLIQIYSNIIPN
jgi:hypothetical protein